MATQRELAEYTGYSIATISRVLNEDPTMSVSESTRSAILEAAGHLHYKAAPRRSKSVPSSTLRLAIAEMLSPVEQLSDPYYLYLKNYAEQRCRDIGCSVTHLVKQQEEYHLDYNEKINGILAIGIFTEAQVLQLSQLSPNLVFLDSSPDETSFDSVVLNFRLGIEQALDYLISQGHTRIAFLGPNNKLDHLKRPAPEARRRHFISYMQEKALFEPSLLLDTQMTAPDARRVLSVLISEGAPLPTAILASNEEVAIGAVSAAREAGLSVPHDLSVISFNDTALSALTDPPLTSVSTHVELMSSAAVELLIRRCTGIDTLPLKVVVPTTLTVRESVKALANSVHI